METTIVYYVENGDKWEPTFRAACVGLPGASLKPRIALEHFMQQPANAQIKGAV